MNAAPRYSALGGKMRKLFPRLCGGGEQRRDPRRSTPTQRGTHTYTHTLRVKNIHAYCTCRQRGHPVYDKDITRQRNAFVLYTPDDAQGHTYKNTLG